MKFNLPPAFDDPKGKPRTWEVPDTIIAAEKLCAHEIRKLLGSEREGKWMAASADGKTAIGDSQDAAEIAMLDMGIPSEEFVVRQISSSDMPRVD